MPDGIIKKTLEEVKNKRDLLFMTMTTKESLAATNMSKP